jgi:MFS family permease
MTQIVTPILPEKAKLLKNFYNVVKVYGAIWVIFHLTTVFFFGFIVGSPLLVGIFLGIGNIWSMLISVSIGTIQRHIPSKTMFAVGNTCMIMAAIVFLYLIRTSDGLDFSLNGWILEITRTFLSTGINMILLLLAGMLYGTVKEVYEITSIAYLLNHSDSSEYDSSLSKYNISMGIGSVFGVLLSIIILSFRTDSVQLILFVLIFLIICAWVFIQNYFDNDHEVFNLNTVKNLNIVEKTKDIEKNTVSYLRETVSTLDFQKLKGSMDYIIMKPKEITKEIDWNEIIEKTKVEYRMLYKLIFVKTTLVPILLWSTGSIILFGCWDTIVMTFFITFMDESLKDSGVQNIIRSGFILIGILAVPAYALQLFWIKKAKTYGKFNIIALGIFVSAGALFGLSIAGNFENLIGLFVVVGLGIINSTGYAASYPMSQSIFADEYNKAYSRTAESNVINADVSAAPLKILNNFANAVGLIFGGALISFVGFSGMFIVYGTAMLAWGIMSMRKKKLWDLE